MPEFKEADTSSEQEMLATTPKELILTRNTGTPITINFNMAIARESYQMYVSLPDIKKLNEEINAMIPESLKNSLKYRFELTHAWSTLIDLDLIRGSNYKKNADWTRPLVTGTKIHNGNKEGNSFEVIQPLELIEEALAKGLQTLHPQGLTIQETVSVDLIEKIKDSARKTIESLRAYEEKGQIGKSITRFPSITQS